ncbi:hypothetical protein OC846_001127 [Tilletia horrida]|uniref:GATA-type domain-containing protein n=1 Tax=Tilletia horrida TaxID=155126 RepID=A0AAN6GU92_9BASI|nr:hypothetical protein OC845_004526 [Tilletia horrida]KAK0556430.1 hypothetical protein OC846_001127 [Tilletia horrida]KAK0569360.1 hypothetical protein OC861_000966 [Tilletia horrida]
MQRPPAPYRMSPNNSNNSKSSSHSTASPSQAAYNPAPTAASTSHHSILPPPEWQMPGDNSGSPRKRSVDPGEYSLHASAAAAAAVAAAAAAASDTNYSSNGLLSRPKQTRPSDSAGSSSAAHNGTLLPKPALQGPDPDSDEGEDGEDDSAIGDASSSSKARRPKKRKTNDDDSKDNSSGESPVKYKKRSRAPAPGVCQACNGSDTPEWRRGPGGARTLCNACGLHWAKLNRKRESTKQPDGSYLLPPITLEDLRAAPLKKSIYDEVPLHGSTTAAAAAAAAAAAVAAAASVPNPPITTAVPHHQPNSHSNTTDGIVAGLSGTGLQHLAGGLISGYARNLQTGSTTLTSAPSPYLGGLSGTASSSIPSSSYTFEPPPLERRYNFSNDRNQPLPSPAPTASSTNGTANGGPTVRTEMSSTRSTANLSPPVSAGTIPVSSASDGAGPLLPPATSSIDSGSRGSGRASSTATTATGSGGSPKLPGKPDAASSTSPIVDGAVPNGTMHSR